MQSEKYHYLIWGPFEMWGFLKPYFRTAKISIPRIGLFLNELQKFIYNFINLLINCSNNFEKYEE